jgi:general secretion pathway protein G
MKNNKQQAFTILELLIVMAIIAILVMIGLGVFGTVREKARDGKRKQDLTAIGRALEMYYNDKGRYPASATGYILGCGQDANQGCLWGGVFQNTSNGTLYMGEIPQDPKGYQYYYSSDSSGTSYYLFAYLENPKDPQAAMSGSGGETFYLNTACKVESGTAVTNSCNYVLMSSNISSLPATVD